MADRAEHVRTEPKPTPRLVGALAELAAVAPPNRREWVEAAFPEDPGTRAELLSLVEHLSPVRPEEGPAQAGGQDPWIGRSIAGCTVLGLLGAGGMGRVYEARQHATNRLVALKLLGDGAMPGFLAERLRAEGAALGALEHHNIARVYQAGVVVVDGGTSPFIVMELVAQARTVGRWAASTDLGPVDRIERMARCCDAVQHAHARGIIHGDVKPANVLFGPDDEPKLIDFGTARLAGAMEGGTGGVRALTPLWAAPEQSSGNQPSASTLTDIYGLGRVAAAALDAPALGRLERRRRLDFEAVVARATATRPEDRYPTAHALACDLRRIVEDRSVSTRCQGPSELAARLVRRHPASTAAVSLAVLAVLVAGALLYRSERSMRRAFAIGQLGQSIAALEAGNWEGAVELSRTARGVGAIPEVLPGMLARRADMASARVRIDGGGVREGIESGAGEWLFAGTFGVAKAPLGSSSSPELLSTSRAESIGQHDGASRIAVARPGGRVEILRGGPGGDRATADFKAEIRSIALPDETHVVVGCADGTVLVGDIENREIHKLAEPTSIAPTMNQGAFVAADGDRHVLAASSDGRLVRVGLSDMELPQDVETDGPLPLTLASHTQTRRFAYGGYGGGLVAGNIETKDHRAVRKFDQSFFDLAFSSDGNLLAVALANGTVAICEPDSLQTVRSVSFGSNRAATWCSFDRTGTRLVAAVDDCVVETPVHPTYRPAFDIGASPRGAGASAMDTMTVWAADGGIRSVTPRTAGIVAWPGPEMPFEPGSISASPTDGRLAGWSGGSLVIRSPSGITISRQLASAGKARTAWTERGDAVWAVRGGRAWLVDAQGTVVASGDVPDRSTLPSLVVLAGGRAALVDVEGSCLLERAGDAVRSSPLTVRGYRAWRVEDGIAAATGDGTLRWSAVAGGTDEARTFGDGGHSVVAVDYSPEQQLLAVGCSDRKVRIWDFGTGELLATLGGHARAPVAVHWLEEGHVLVSIDLDGKAQTWTDLPVEPVEEVTGASGSRAP